MTSKSGQRQGQKQILYGNDKQKGQIRRFWLRQNDDFEWLRQNDDFKWLRQNDDFKWLRQNDEQERATARTEADSLRE